ncbi:uncharacterized protein LOC106674249 isoform X2 [Cimex lectularius]|uniref:Uncharacterized protein n=1 Tax=Cimex lectularius TaxID=79782 RepID=A0A8I6SQU7_CIMLE|nr:uncharacterized protein LOC106674249 isoform X2 [Cimex lectularius]
MWMINPLTGRSSSSRPCSQASSISTLIDIRSSEGSVLDDKGSSEDDMDVVGGTPDILTEEPLARPESRRQDSTMEQSGKKVQEWFDKSFSHVKLTSQIAKDQESGQRLDTPYSPEMVKQYKLDCNYSQDDPFTVRKYLPDQGQEEETEKYTAELFQEKDTFYSNMEKKVVKSNFTEAREIIKSLNSMDNKKFTEEIVKKEQKRRVTKGKKISKDKKKGKGKAANKVKEDNDEIVSSPKIQQHDFSGNPIILNQEENHRYKSLLGELNTFMKSNKNAMVGKRQTLNLKPVNINMEEFEDWLDEVDNGNYNKNEVSERYQIKEEIFPGVFELPTNEKTVTNAKTVKKKRRPLKKSVEKKNNSEEKITPEYSDMPYLKQAWECDKSETKKNTYAFEMPIEVLDEEVLNSWRSTPYFHKEREEKVIRVVPEKKPDCDEMDVLIDIE